MPRTLTTASASPTKAIGDLPQPYARDAGLNEMVLAGLSQSIAFVLHKNHLIHPDTVLARNELLLEG